MNPSVFREYDIRGVAERDLGGDFARLLGRAMGQRLHAVRSPALAAEARPRLVVGRDCRVSSPRLARALIAGARAVGVDVIELGVVPTPVFYYAVHALAPEGGVQVTGSHNPARDNGFKLICAGERLHGPAIQELRAAMELAEAQGQPGGAAAPEPGQCTTHDATAAYLRMSAASLRMGPRRCKLVLDAANGAGGPTALALFRQLGFEVEPLYCEMDGRFPNHSPDPLVPANLVDLRQRVRDTGAELGIALDGDADRIAAVDARDRVMWGDQLMILLGQALLREHPGCDIVAEVKCSQALFDLLAAAGGVVHMGRAGHALVKAKMRETGALLGGELSGHLFFADRHPGYDDGIYAGARLLELLSHAPTTLAEHCDSLPAMVNTPELRLACPDEAKFAVVAAAGARLRARDDIRGVVEIDGTRVTFADGWGLVRASNTEPALVLRCEASSHERLSAIRTLLEETVAAAMDDAGAPTPGTTP
ncbi:phosphomannomutase/phosphoglucomutase [Haliangium ochraceum]|uniref:Phosphomannomutase n=1 Tax=Haliangium ochraceum (strain DSM 14365 / JCM 11303 / SMP-2) TaxID=502025 RepID=D0LVH6_HALO1|nr:phosphomannomutase/phosphoglucomutase [Haliangium ochraceum]ACY17537.1 Phosphomannomutase [Haliangium ochraceum DSM 14365]